MTTYTIKQKTVEQNQEFELPDNAEQVEIERKDIAGRETKYVVDYLVTIEDE